MSGEVAALVLTVAVHVVGAIALVGFLMRNSDVDWREWWPTDDDGRGPEVPEPPAAPNAPGGDGLPLPASAAPARVRLREPARLGESYPRTPRRPVHPPAPERTPERTGR